MRDHFAYLVDDDANAFFQKVAVDAAGVKATERPRPSMTKTADPSSTPFEKVAARLDRDLETLHLAGDCGMNSGMMKRASAYLDVLFAHANLQPDEYGSTFDKVAARAIEIDLSEAYQQLCAELPEEQHHVVDDVLIKIGHELTAAAIEEKELLIDKLAISLGALGHLGAEAKAAKGLSRASEAVRGAEGIEGAAKATGAAREFGMTTRTKGVGAMGEAKAIARGGAEGVKSVARRIGNKAQDIVGAVNNKTIGRVKRWHQGRIDAAPARIQSALEKEKALGITGGAQGAYSAGKQQSYQAQLAKAEAKRTASAAKNAKLPARPTMPATEGGAQAAAKAAKPPAAPKTEAPAAAKAEGKGEAPKATEGGKAEPAGEAAGSSSSPAAGGHTPPPPGGTEGKPPGFMDAWKKATTSGWKSLSEGERGTLVRGGVTAALVYRGVTGKGAVTGGEGII